MRYAKGCISLNPLRDIPLLLEVRNSRFISHEQLFELMNLCGCEPSRSGFNWRVKRLLVAKSVVVFSGNYHHGTVVYRITSSGLSQLEDHGHFAAVLNSKTQHLPHPSQINHALELNAIHIALIRARVLVHWQSDVE